MAVPGTLRIHPVAHPVTAVRDAGYALDHPYVEHVWASTLGPSATLLLRRFVVLWRDAVPAEVEPDQLARSLGVGHKTEANSPLMRTIQRLVQFGAAEWDGGEDLYVYTELPPLGPGRLVKGGTLVRRFAAAHHLVPTNLEACDDSNRARANEM